MRIPLTAVMILLAGLILAGCGPTRTEIRTETSRTERTLSREIVDPGTEKAGEESGTEPAPEVETETQTEERVIDRRPVIR